MSGNVDATVYQRMHYSMVIYTILMNFLPVKGSVYVRIDSNAVGQGTYARFVCLVRGTDQPAMVHTWLKDGHTLQSNTRASSLPPPYYNQLVIRNAQPADTGMYTCVTDKGQNSTQYLVVYCPIVTYPKPVIRAVVGGNVTLRCDGECYDYIFWFKDNYQVIGVEPERFYSPGNGSALFIRNVTTSDNGSFLCEFISIRTTYREVELFVIEPADQVTVSTSSSVADVGHDYEIRCESNGQPLPKSVSWFNDSKPIRSTTRVSTWYDNETGTATLSISPLTRYDLSKVECRFEQELLEGQLNYVNAVIPITPTDKPDPPTDLYTDVVVISDLSVRLKVQLFWTHPIYTGNLQKLAYRVTYWDENECQRSLCKEEEYWLDGSVVSHQFDLQRYANHTRLCFSVQSVNNDGLSVPSEKTCVGVRRDPTAPSSPTPRKPQSETKKGLTTEPPRPAARRTFQVALKNAGKLCSGLQVSEGALTRALAYLFSLLCSCSVLTDDLTVDSFSQLGDVIYYRGLLQSPQADNILSNLSHHIQHGSDRLRLSGGYVVFLASCPTRLNDGVCKISSEDCSSLSCTPSTNSPHTDNIAATDRQSLSQRGIIIISVLGGLLAIMFSVEIITLCYCHRKVGAANKARCKRTPSTQPIFHHMNGSVPGSQSQISVSRASTSSSSHSDVTDLEQLTSSKRTLVKHSPYRRGHPSHDSAISDESFRSEIDAYGAVNSNDDVFFAPDKKERGETRV